MKFHSLRAAPPQRSNGCQRVIPPGDIFTGVLKICLIQEADPTLALFVNGGIQKKKIFKPKYFKQWQ